MTNAERILAEIQGSEGLSDADLRCRTGIEPHQQVNHLCRRLAAQGLIERRPDAHGRIRNFTSSQPLAPLAGTPSGSPRPARVVESERTVELPSSEKTLVVVPCSARKAKGGSSEPGPSVLDLLPSGLADKLRSARRAVAAPAHLDETTVMPAWRRYTGTLYLQAADPLGSTGVPVVILSGGYGILLGGDAIGRYDRRFTLADWPRGLLEECLISVCEANASRHVVAFCARTTSYADLLRRVPWKANEIEAVLASAELGGGGGAQVLVPRAAGQAVSAFLNGHLDAHFWRSSDNVPVIVERLHAL